MSLHFSKSNQFTGHTGSVYALEYFNEEETFLSAGSDGYIVKWNTHTPDEGEVIAKASDVVYSLNYHSDSPYVLAGKGNGQVSVLSVSENKELRSLQLHTSSVFLIHNLKEKELIITLGGDGVFSVIHSRTFTLIHQQRLSTAKLRSMIINTESGIIYIGCGEGKIYLIDLYDFKLITVLQAHEPGFSVNALAISPDGTYLYSGSRDAHVHVYDIKTHNTLEKIPAHNYAVYALQFSPDGQYLASASRDKTIKLWNSDMQVLQRLDKNREGHSNSVNTLSWLNNRQLITAGDDRSIILWTME